MDNLPRLPRRQKCRSRIGGLLDHLRHNFRCGGVVGERYRLANLLADWRTKEPNRDDEEYSYANEIFPSAFHLERLLSQHCKDQGNGQSNGLAEQGRGISKRGSA